MAGEGEDRRCLNDRIFSSGYVPIGIYERSEVLGLSIDLASGVHRREYSLFQVVQLSEALRGTPYFGREIAMEGDDGRTIATKMDDLSICYVLPGRNFDDSEEPLVLNDTASNSIFITGFMSE